LHVQLVALVGGVRRGAQLDLEARMGRLEAGKLCAQHDGLAADGAAGHT
jgi:hypothetical protein